MSDDLRPSAEGMKRYPETGGYYDIPEGFLAEGEGEPTSNRQPCTCAEPCPSDCSGECGCDACSWRYVVENDAGQTYPHEFP